MDGTQQRQKVRVSAFGPLTEILAEAVFELELSFPAAAEDLAAELARQVPALRGRRYQLAVDERIVRGSQPITEATEIALLPPFAGG
jgi:molybdopterin converting factor small subunit